MVDVGAGHLAHQGNPPEGVGVGPLLRGADGGDGEGSVAVGTGNEGVGVFHGDAGHGAGGGEKEDVRARLHKIGDVLLGEDALRRLGQHACRVHLACRQHNGVAHGFPEAPESRSDGLVGHAHAGVARQKNKIDAQSLGPQGVFHGGQPPGG